MPKKTKRRKVLPRVLRVNVSQRDIDAGRPGYPFCCPVAVAVRRTAGVNVAYVGDDGHATFGGRRWRLPPAARRFVGEFDRSYGSRARPFSFRMTREG